MPQEDDLVRHLVAIYGPQKWSVIAEHLPGRIGKQCRERWVPHRLPCRLPHVVQIPPPGWHRWHNHLNPGIRKGNWTAEEDTWVFEAHAALGNKWADIAKVIDGRCVIAGWCSAAANAHTPCPPFPPQHRQQH